MGYHMSWDYLHGVEVIHSFSGCIKAGGAEKKKLKDEYSQRRALKI